MASQREEILVKRIYSSWPTTSWYPLSEAEPAEVELEWCLLKAQLYRKWNWQQLTWPQINGLFSTTCPSILLLVDLLLTIPVATAAHHPCGHCSSPSLWPLLLTIPVATAECERGFSRMNQIKNEFRTRLQPGIVSDILRIQQYCAV